MIPGAHPGGSYANKVIMKTTIKDNTSMGDRVFNVFNIVFMTIFAFICFYPFYYIVINTVSANHLVDRGNILLYPIGFHLENYAKIFKLDRLLPAAVVSVARTALGMLFPPLTAAYMGYLFTKDDMLHKKFWYRLMIITMYFSAGMIPHYLNIRMLGLLNTFWVYVIPSLFPVYSMVLVKTYIESLPSDLEEAAEIDGAGIFARFTRIILPLSTPILATLSLLAGVGQWNAFQDTLLYIQDYKLYTLQYLLQLYYKQASNLAIIALESQGQIDVSRLLTPTSVQLTITVVVTLPIMCVYPFIQRYYVKGIMIGAIKG